MVINTYINERGEIHYFPGRFIKPLTRLHNTKTGKTFTVIDILPLENKLLLEVNVNGRACQCNYLISSMLRDIEKGIFVKQ